MTELTEKMRIMMMTVTVRTMAKKRMMKESFDI